MACLHDLSELLSENPRRGMAPPDIAADLRHFPVGDYLVLYRNLGDRVEIVRYVHGCLRLQDLAQFRGCPRNCKRRADDH